MKKMKKILALALAASVLSASFFGCKNDDDGSLPPVTPETPVTPSTPASLVKFNAAATEFVAQNMIIKGSASSGGKEGYLVFNEKVDTSKKYVVEADVSFSSLSGHVGLGFMSVTGGDRKGYSLLTGQNIKNVTCSLGGGGNGLEPSVSWATGTTYHFKATFDPASYAADDTSANTITYEVLDAGGALLGSNKTPYYHSSTDVVYVAFGGTTAENASYSNIKITVADKEYTFTELKEQSVLPLIEVKPSEVRLLLGDEPATITYTSVAAGGKSAAVDLVYDNKLFDVADNRSGTLTVTSKAATTGTTLTVKNHSAEYLSAVITVIIEDFNKSDSYGELKSVYPAANAENAYEDGEFRITFDSAPTVSPSGSFSIYDSDGNWVDTIKASNETLTPSTGTAVNVKSQLIRTDGNNVYFTPHFGVLKAGKTYYVAIPKGTITGTKLNGVDFDGLTSNKDNASWKFTVRTAPAVGSTITVDASENSTADFRTINGALSAIGASKGDYTVNIAAGTYREIVHFNGEANITLAGPENNRGDDTVIQWTNLNKWNGSMDTRSVVYFGSKAGNVVVKNITIKNTCDRSREGTADTQAEAIYYKGANKLAVYNCSLLSHQDTICTRGKAWFYDCYIEGDTDFIWGYADVCLIEECDIKCLYDEAKANSSTDSILLVARTGSKSAAKIGKGFVIFNSKVTVEDKMTAYFGRNAGSGDFYDQDAVINTEFVCEGTGKVSTALWSGQTYDFIKDKADKVGCKYYGLTGVKLDGTDKNANVVAISDADYAKEFNGRRAILNRVYDVEKDKYVAASTAWDISALEADASTTEDESKNNDYSDEVVTNGAVEYDMTTPMNTWLTANYSGQFTSTEEVVYENSLVYSVNAGGNFKYDGGNGCTTVANGIIKIPVTGNCTIKVKCHSYNSQYIQVNDETKSAGTDLEFAYTGSAGYVTLTASDTSKVLYIYNIKVENVYTDWDMTTPMNAWLTANYSGQFTSTEEVVYENSLVYSVNAGGNFKYDGGNGCTTVANGVIKIPVTGNCTIKVKCHSYNSQYIQVNDETKSAGTDLEFAYTGSAGYVTLTASDTSKVLYIYNIKAEYNQ